MFIQQMFLGDMKRLVFILCMMFWAFVSGAQGIRTAADLIALSDAMTNGKPIDQWRNEDGYVCLEADIDMAKVKKFEPIPFWREVFDGNGYEIRNWKAKNSLFHHILPGGVVRNLTIAESCSMKTGIPVDQECYVGFISNISIGRGSRSTSLPSRASS